MGKKKSIKVPMSTTQKKFPSPLSVWLSLIAGIILVFFGLVTYIFETIILSDIIWTDVFPFSVDVIFSTTLSLFAGVIIIVTSIFMFIKKDYIRSFGIVVLIFSIIACFGMGIFTIGGIIGITGGVFAILEKKK